MINLKDMKVNYAIYTNDQEPSTLLVEIEIPNPLGVAPLQAKLNLVSMKRALSPLVTRIVKEVLEKEGFSPKEYNKYSLTNVDLTSENIKFTVHVSKERRKKGFLSRLLRR